MKLDDRLFLLQHTQELPEEQKQKLFNADIAYLQDRNAEAERLVSEIEAWCEDNGIDIFSLTNHPLYGKLVA